VAVLCQFLDEIDYATAFKALQEKTSHDAMDGCYDCIWDAAILEFLISILYIRPDQATYLLSAEYQKN